MKKAIGFLILLSSLALLDGTPVHNHHGKYISSRTKSSLHDSNGFVAASMIDDDLIVDQDDDHLPDINSCSQEFFRFIHNTPDLVVVVLPSSGISSVPLYRLACDMRI